MAFVRVRHAAAVTMALSIQTAVASRYNCRAMNAEIKVALDTMWVVLTAGLVFFMNAGFAMLESGLCRSKNAVNILAKNVVVFAAASLAFWVAGFAFMFGDGSAAIGLSGWMLHGADNSPLTGPAY